MPPEQQGRVRGLVDQIRKMDDPAKIAPKIEPMQKLLDSGQVPEDQQKLMGYMLKTMKARLAELEAAKKESN